MTGRPSRKRTIPARLRDSGESPKKKPVKQTLQSREKLDPTLAATPPSSVDPTPTPPIVTTASLLPVNPPQSVQNLIRTQDSDLSDSDGLDLDEIEDEKIELISNVQNASSNYPTGPPNEKWSVTDLKNFLKVQKKKTSQMNKKALLQLATLTFSNQSQSDFTPSDIAKLRREENDLIERRKVFDDNLQWDDIQNISNNIIPKQFDIEVVNTFLRSSYITIKDKLVHSEVEKPNVKGRNLYFSDVIQSCQVASNQELLFFRCEIGASMKNLIR